MDIFPLNFLIPCHNQTGNIALLMHRVAEALRGTEYEIIFIDDGSTGSTLTITRNSKQSAVIQ